MLELRKVSAAYGRAQILFGLDLELRAGEVLALLGRNGAGKTTTLKVAMGLLPCLSGQRLFIGENLKSLEPHAIARLGLGYVPEDRRIFTELTVVENLEVGRQPARAGLPAWTPGNLFELFPNLGRMRARRGGEMSGGEQQMLAIARTLMGNPRAVLLDEPFEGLAPLIVDGVARAILELKRAGLSVLLCEQNPRHARRLADRTCTIDKGQIRNGG
jgi:branched-chain amino acid transport system ATP-binding protein